MGETQRALERAAVEGLDCASIDTVVQRGARVACVWLGAWVLWAAVFASWASAAELSGDPVLWHRIEVRFEGPFSSESASAPNPFLDYRLQCTFTAPSGRTYEVPGFFDTNGQGGSSGRLFTCRFAPDETGTWSYQASFREGAGVAVSLDDDAGSPTSFDGETGSFVVAPSDKVGRDFRSPSRGRLVNTGQHYLTFLGSGEGWIKGGPDIPENLLGYEGFDNTPDAGHAFAAHVGDWRPGDPDWGSGDGRGIIGALNFVADAGGNCLYFLPMNIGGDGRDTFPTLSPNDKTHYDTSKLDQWEEVFTHADALGIFLHFQLSETESANANYHDGGSLGPQRKLFYRELVARFGHHLGLEWDLGEENNYGTQRRRDFAAYIKAIDPYDHPLTTHIKTNQMNTFYGPLLGNEDFDMTAFQVNYSGFERGDIIIEWRERSAAAGVPWVVSLDEPQTIENDPDDAGRGLPRGRTDYMWPTYLSGGGGFEWYVQEDGGGHSLDQRLDDFRPLEPAFRWTRIALDFMDTIPFLRMEPRPELGSSSAGGDTHVLAAPGEAYALYNEDGGAFELDLRGEPGSYEVTWLDPETGVWTSGPVVEGGARVSLGSPPFSGDAAVRVLATGTAGADPIAVATATPDSGVTPLVVQLDGSASSDDGTIERYEWDLGDGSTAEGATPSHVYADPGTYLATLRVIDDDDRFDETTLTIEVDADVDPPSGSTVILTPEADVYVQGSHGFDNQLLKIEAGQRTAYLRFDVAGTPEASSVSLLLRQSADASSGIQMQVHASSDVAWTESGINAANAPISEELLGSYDGPVPNGSEIEIPLPAGTLEGRTAITLVVSSTAGGDAWFGSSESLLTPELRIETSEAEPADFDGDGVVGPADFYFLLRPCIGSSVVDRPECTPADLDGDGFVGASDFLSEFRPALTD